MAGSERARSRHTQPKSGAAAKCDVLRDLVVFQPVLHRLQRSDLRSGGVPEGGRRRTPGGGRGEENELREGAWGRGGDRDRTETPLEFSITTAV